MDGTEIQRKKEISNFFRKYFRKLSSLNKKIDELLLKKRQTISLIDNTKKASKTVIYRDCEIKTYKITESIFVYKAIDWDKQIIESNETNEFYKDVVPLVNTMQTTSNELDRTIQYIESVGYPRLASNARQKLSSITRDANLPEFPKLYYLDLDRAKKRIDETLNSPTLLRFSSKEEYFAFKEDRIREKDEEERKVEESRLRQRKLAQDYQLRLSGILTKPSTISMSDLLSLDPRAFESWVKENILEREGWEVKLTKKTRDGGIDLLLANYRNHKNAIAQCKRYRGIVSESFIRDFYGTMISENADIGYFITTGHFSNPALEFAKNKPITMIDRNKLLKYLN